MKRGLYDPLAFAFFLLALAAGVIGIVRGEPGSAMLLVTPIVVFAVITYAQRLPVSSLNLTVKVTPENSARIEPVARDFLALVKVLAMMLVAWLDCWVVLHLPRAAFLAGEGMFLVMLFASTAAFIRKVAALA